MFIHPLFESFGTWIWYQRRPRRSNVLVMAAGAGGLILVCTGVIKNGDRFDTRWRLGILLPLFSGICIGVEKIWKSTLHTVLHWVQVEYMTSFLFVVVLIPLSWLFQFLYIETIGSIHFQNFNIFLADPNISHWVVFIGIGIITVLAAYGAQRASKILDRRFVNITSYLQVPILYVVDVLWFENGLPGLFEIIGSTLFVLVLIVNSLLEPILVAKISKDRVDEEMGLLLNSVTFEDENEKNYKLSLVSKGTNPGGGYYGSVFRKSGELFQ